MNSKFLATSVSAAVMASSIVPTVQAEGKAFIDVKSDDYFFAAVNDLSARNIIKGYENDTFRPYQTVTRAQAAKMLAMTLGLEASNVKNPGFTDVKTSDWYYGSVAALVNAGVIKGYEDKTFRPNEPLTRAQMAKVIALGFNLGEKSVSKFSDIKEDDWFAGYVGSLIEKDITTGTTSTTFSPNKNITRGQAAAFIYRAEQAKKLAYEIDSVTDSAVVINGVSYKLDNGVKSVLNGANAAALKNALIQFEAKDDVITKITSLEIKAGGQGPKDQLVFDGKNGYIDGNLKVSADYVSVQNVTVKGNLELNSTVKNNFYANNVKVEGSTIVAAEETKQAVNASEGKGSNSFAYQQKDGVTAETANVSITFENSILRKVEVKNDKAALNMKGSTKVDEIAVFANASITGEATASFEKLVIENHVTAVDLNGAVKDAVLKGGETFALSGKGTIQNLIIENKDAKITIGKDSKITNVTLPSGAKIEDVIKNYEDIKSNISKVDGNPTSTTPSGGGSGGSSEPVIPAQITAAGTYGPAAGKQIVEGDLTIKSSDVILKNLIITGNLVIDEAVGEGDVTLNGVEVKGTTEIRGGGANSIHFKDSVLLTVIVNKNNGAIRIVAEGSTQVRDLQLESYARIEETDLQGGAQGFTNVILTEAIRNVSPNLNVELVGAFDTINSRAASVRINLPANTSIENLVVNALAEINSAPESRIRTARINAENVVLTQRPSNLVIQIPGGGAVTVGDNMVTEDYSEATTAELANINVKKQGIIDLQFSEFVAGLKAEDFVVTAQYIEEDGEPSDEDAPTINVTNYNPSTQKIFYELEGNILSGKKLRVTVTPNAQSERVTGEAKSDTVTISTGFQGRITDIHGAGVAGVTIKFREGFGQDGEVAGEATTDEHGYYSVTLPAGSYTGEISGAGFITTHFLAVAPDNRYGTDQNGTAIRAAATSEVKIMLSWDEHPEDLDSHLTGPEAGGSGKFHVWYSDRTAEGTNGIILADLDWDDVDSYGPETTTIRQLADGTYTFIVHHFSGQNTLRQSGAKVQVFKGNSSSPAETFTVPAGEGNERYWTVFKLTVSDNGETIDITPVNNLSDSAPREIFADKLENLLEEAHEAYDAAVEVSAEEEPAVGQYVSGSKAQLLAAIESAQVVYDDIDATEADVEEAAHHLSDALEQFYNNRFISTDDEEFGLSYMITTFQAIHDEAVEGTEPGEYEPGSKALFQQAIEEANDILEQNVVTLDELNAALDALQTAYDEFEEARVASPGSSLHITLSEADLQTLRALLEVADADYLEALINVTNVEHLRAVLNVSDLQHLQTLLTESNAQHLQALLANEQNVQMLQSLLSNDSNVQLLQQLLANPTNLQLLAGFVTNESDLEHLEALLSNPANIETLQELFETLDAHDLQALLTASNVQDLQTLLNVSDVQLLQEVLNIPALEVILTQLSQYSSEQLVEQAKALISVEKLVQPIAGENREYGFWIEPSDVNGYSGLVLKGKSDPYSDDVYFTWSKEQQFEDGSGILTLVDYGTLADDPSDDVFYTYYFETNTINGVTTIQFMDGEHPEVPEHGGGSGGHIPSDEEGHVSTDFLQALIAEAAAILEDHVDYEFDMRSSLQEEVDLAEALLSAEVILPAELENAVHSLIRALDLSHLEFASKTAEMTLANPGAAAGTPELQALQLALNAAQEIDETTTNEALSEKVSALIHALVAVQSMSNDGNGLELE